MRRTGSAKRRKPDGPNQVLSPALLRNSAPTRAAVPQYRMLQNRIGTTRVVIVTPRNYRVDNRATVDAIT